ncbi:TEC1 family protein [Pleurotus pulmonarius]
MPRHRAMYFKSLTPKRKHWKTAGGAEVWPEHIEEVFVQGLIDYKNSPFAACPGGRSRYRNQFLVEHLAKAGIIRSRKQVASHVQVLRGMWKGTPGFYLLANGKEFADLSPPIRTKLEQHNIHDHRHPDVQHALSLPQPVSPSSSVISSLNSSPASNHSQLQLQYDVSHGYPDKQVALLPPQHLFSEEVHRPFAPHSMANQLVAFCLVANGAQPLVVTFDAIVEPASVFGHAWAMKTKLYMTAPDSFCDEYQGFTGSVVLVAPFVSGTCTTQVFRGKQRIHTENGPLFRSPTDPLAALLPPNSPLATCWSYFNDPSSTSITLTQELIVDGITLLFAVYDLCGAGGSKTPSAQLIRCRPCQGNLRESYTVSQSPSLSYTAYDVATLSPTPRQHTDALLTSSPSLGAASSRASYPLAASAMHSPLLPYSALIASQVYPYYPTC